jgi:hypothetical protein
MLVLQSGSSILAWMLIPLKMATTQTQILTTQSIVASTQYFSRFIDTVLLSRLNVFPPCPHLKNDQERKVLVRNLKG